MRPICIIYEDEGRTDDLIDALIRVGVHEGLIKLWFITSGTLGFMAPPERDWVYFSRLSASAKTRDHSHSLAYGKNVLVWLEEYGCQVHNGLSAFELETNKINQYYALQRVGIQIPPTIATCGVKPLVELVKEHAPVDPFYVKPVTGGSGMSVKRFANATKFLSEAKNLSKLSMDIKAPDQMYLFQEAREEQADWYSRTKHKLVGKLKIFYRAEFVNRKFLYLLRIRTPVILTSTCPKCDAPTRYDTDFTIVDPESVTTQGRWLEFLEKAHELINLYHIDACAFEFSIPDPRTGIPCAYDLNTNTNYNTNAEKKLEENQKGMHQIALMLKTCAE